MRAITAGHAGEAVAVSVKVSTYRVDKFLYRDDVRGENQYSLVKDLY